MPARSGGTASQGDASGDEISSHEGSLTLAGKVLCSPGCSLLISCTTGTHLPVAQPHGSCCLKGSQNTTRSLISASCFTNR